MMGGVVTDLCGRSSARAAVRGRRGRAHRRARRESAGVELAARGTRVRRARRARPGDDIAARRKPPAAANWNVPPLADRGAAQVAADAHPRRDVGARGHRSHRARAAHALDELDEIGSALPAGATEEPNMLETARLIVEAALHAEGIARRTLSHRLPAREAEWKGRHIELVTSEFATVDEH